MDYVFASIAYYKIEKLLMCVYLTIQNIIVTLFILCHQTIALKKLRPKPSRKGLSK